MAVRGWRTIRGRRAVIASGATRCCQRSQNEDSYRLPALGETPPLYLLADGMGGAAGGEVASRLAVEACVEAFYGTRAAAPSIEARLSLSWRYANARVFAAAERRPSLRGMGATLTGFAFAPGEPRLGGVSTWVDLWVAHVGDSRCYGLRDGELLQLTDDHTLVEDYVRRGIMTRAEAAVCPARNALLRAVGTSRSVAVDVARVRDVGQGDAFLLVSDGVTGALDNAAIRALLIAGADAEGVVEEAERAGASDNCTAVLVRV
jgi:PPM family protein phosphatase